MPTWPSTLPVAAVSGYGFEPVDPVVRTAMESGPKRARRQFTQTTATLNVRWLFDQTQMAAFESFHQNDINDGAGWFDYPFLNGQGKNVVPARFAKMFKANLIGINPARWEVLGELEIKNRPVAS